jgi:hypothetical protein
MGAYVAPWCTPDECDHEGTPGDKCSHCCPCWQCSELRRWSLDTETTAMYEWGYVWDSGTGRWTSEEE